MGQVVNEGVTFEFITQEQDPQNGPYYRNLEFPAIRVYRPNTVKNPSPEWLAIDYDANQNFKGNKSDAFNKATNWIKTRERENELKKLTLKTTAEK